MKKNTLTFGAKINCTFAALATVLALAVWFGFHSTDTLQALLEHATGKSTRKIERIGAMNTAGANLAAGQRGAILYTYAKQADESAAARALFRRNSSAFGKALAELERLVDAGDSDGATKLLVSRIKPQYVALGEDCAKLVEIANKLIEEDRRAAHDP